MDLLDGNNECYFVPGSQISCKLISMERTLIMSCKTMLMSPGLAILHNWEISTGEQEPPWKRSAAGKAGSRETCCHFGLAHCPPRPVSEGASSMNLQETEESHSPNPTEVPALCLSWAGGQMWKQQASPFTSFWQFPRSKFIFYKLYENLDLIQMCFLEEEWFHQLRCARADRSHSFS